VRVVRRSTLIDSWVGFSRGSDGEARVTLTWIPKRPAAASPAGPQSVVVKATLPGGAALFEGRIGAARGAAAADSASSASFSAPVGRIEIDLSILDAGGKVIDTDARDVDVPPLGGPRAVLLAPHVIRTGSAREFRAMSVDPDAPPTPAREFRRTERLLIRAPAYGADGRAVPVAARMLNRMGQVLWEIAPMRETSRGVAQFDVSLAPLATGDYTIELTAPTPAGEAKEHVRIRVTG
jgi:hypothetical protein